MTCESLVNALPQKGATLVAGPAFFDISMPRIEAAAKERFGSSATVGPAYWLDAEVLRFPVSLDGGNLSFGANYYFREGVFR